MLIRLVIKTHPFPKGMFLFGKDVPSQMEIAMLPYVVSEDIALLLRAWADVKEFSIPSEASFLSWREEFSSVLRKIFPHFISISEQEMTQGLATLMAQTGLPVLSLDGVYVQADLSLELARQVDKEGKDVGIGHRPGTPSLWHQLRQLRERRIREVVLVDDVIFSGSLIERTCRLLERLPIRAPVICAGVGIGEGVGKLIHQGYDVRCVRMFDRVIDEVCERDFVPGVPQSGRALRGEDWVGIPYLFPFGDPVKWASIPKEHAVSFSAFCLAQTIILFQEIERCSGRSVRCCDLSRIPVGLPQDETRFVDALRHVL